MKDWVELEKKPIQIGNSRGFVVPKTKLRLKSSKIYIIKIIEEEKYHEARLSNTKRNHKFTPSEQYERVGVYQRYRAAQTPMGARTNENQER